MHYYLSPLTGTGTSTDPFIPDVATAGVDWGMIDLRGDPTIANGRTIVWVEARPNTDPAQSVYLDEDVEAQLVAPAPQRLSEALGVPFDPQTENTIKQIISSMLTTHSSPTGNVRPKPLTVQANGKRMIYFYTNWEV